MSPWDANISLSYSMQILFISSPCPCKEFWQLPRWPEWMMSEWRVFALALAEWLWGFYYCKTAL